MRSPLVRLLLPALVLTAAAPLAAQISSPGGPVPVELLQKRRAAFLATMPKGVAVIESSKIKSIDRGDYPQDADYRENANFFYFTGVESPGGRLVFVQPDSGSAQGSMTLFLPAPPAVRDAWSAARVYADTMAERVTGLPMAAIKPLPTPVRAARAPGAPIPTTPPDAFAPTVDSLLGATGLSRINERRTLAPLRWVKDADEIRRLRLASSITAEAHSAAMQQSRPGMWEYEIEGIVEYTFRRRGAERVGYPSIVGSGPNSTILHYDISRRQSKPGEVVLIDAAAEFGYYSTDLTRTFPIDGKFTPRQKAVYELVLGAQQAALDSVKPGMTLARLEQIARGWMKEHSGTICDPTITCENRKFFNHGMSHPVGLDVHDLNPQFSALQPGVTFTIEPGIYLPEESLGVRIEDVVLVTDNGYEILTKGAPRTVADIEKVMAQGRSGVAKPAATRKP